MKRELSAFIILAVLSAALITLRIRVSTITQAPQRVSTQLIKLLHQVKSESGKTINSIVEATQAIEENRELKGKILQLKQKLALMKQLEAENRRLKLLLGIKKLYHIRSIPARVVGWSGDYWQHRFILDKGRKDGVKEGMAVVGAQGIVGQVRVVFNHSCIAISTTDPEFSIHVEDYRSKVRGIARGNGKRLVVDYILPSMDVKVGDLLVSTGIGGIFPPGLFVGRVIRVSKSLEERFLIVEAVPTDRIENNRFVLIMGEERLAQKKKTR